MKISDILMMSLVVAVLNLMGQLKKYTTVYTTYKDIQYVEENKSSNFVESWEKLLSLYDIKFPEVVLAQMLHETGAFKSKICIECNNLFGMKYTESRNISTGVCRGHAKYREKSHSVQDYAEWQQKYLPLYEKRYNKKVVTNEDYIQFLVDQNYAEDKLYASKLQLWLKKIESWIH